VVTWCFASRDSPPLVALVFTLHWIVDAPWRLLRSSFSYTFLSRCDKALSKFPQILTDSDKFLEVNGSRYKRFVYSQKHFFLLVLLVEIPFFPGFETSVGKIFCFFKIFEDKTNSSFIFLDTLRFFWYIHYMILVKYHGKRTVVTLFLPHQMTHLDSLEAFRRFYGIFKHSTGFYFSKILRYLL